MAGSQCHALLMLSLVIAPVRLAADVLAIGQTVPPFRLREVLQGSTPEPRAGEAFVVEFWASWCAPCRRNISHLNMLARQFAGRPLKFLSISDEQAEVVRHFLADHQIEGSVALDDNDLIFHAFGAGYPTTALINSEGNLVAVTNPSLVTPAILEDLMANRPIYMEDSRILKKKWLNGDAIQSDDGSLSRVSVWPSGCDGRRTVNVSFQYETRGSPLRDMVLKQAGTARNAMYAKPTVSPDATLPTANSLGLI